MVSGWLEVKLNGAWVRIDQQLLHFSFYAEQLARWGGRWGCPGELLYHR